jgi:hypothetical protein
MRWKTETLAERRERLMIWRPWFAWRPVMIGNERVWLEWVYYRTKLYYGGDGVTLQEHEYADTMSILKKQKYEVEYDGLE